MVKAMQVSIDDRGLFRKIAKAKLKIAKASRNTVDDLGEIGKQYARSIAPYHTGRTARFIKLFKRQGANGPTATVQAQNPTAGGSGRLFGPGQYSNFNLVRWMHLTGGVFQSDNPYGQAGKKHIKSGDPQFMYTTRRYLNKIKKGVATGRFKNINLK